MKPTNSPTQGQPNPRKNRLKVGIWATFSHSKYFFVGWDWFHTGNRLQEPYVAQPFFPRPIIYIFRGRYTPDLYDLAQVETSTHRTDVRFPLDDLDQPDRADIFPICV